MGFQQRLLKLRYWFNRTFHRPLQRDTSPLPTAHGIRTWTTDDGIEVLLVDYTAWPKQAEFLERIADQSYPDGKASKWFRQEHLVDFTVR